MEGKNSTRELRIFGLFVGSVFLVIGLWPLIRHDEGPRVWAICLGGGLVGLGGAFPWILKPVYAVWMKLGHLVGLINTRIILGIVFFGLITPIGLAMRLFGWDAMRRGFDNDSPTYRVICRPRPRAHMKHQF